jgi:hypothetical protein
MPQSVKGSDSHTSGARYPLWGPLSLLFSGCLESFPQLRRPRSENDLPSPTSAEIKNEWSYTSTAPTCLHGEHSNKNKVLQSLLSERMRTGRGHEPRGP